VRPLDDYYRTEVEKLKERALYLQRELTNQPNASHQSDQLEQLRTRVKVSRNMVFMKEFSLGIGVVVCPCRGNWVFVYHCRIAGCATREG
jgi:hypothetical protein